MKLICANLCELLWWIHLFGGLIYLKSLDDKFKIAFKRVIAFSGFFSSWSRVTKTAADDGSRGIFASGTEGSLVADTETDHPGIAKIHFFDLFKVSTFLPVKVLLSSCGGSR